MNPGCYRTSFRGIIISNSGFKVCDFFLKMSHFIKYFCTRQLGDKRILIRKARDGNIKKPEIQLPCSCLLRFYSVFQNCNSIYCTPLLYENS